jgi:hypothetical protein
MDGKTGEALTAGLGEREHESRWEFWAF